MSGEVAKASATPIVKEKTTIGYYDMGKNIGEGNFAKVKLATHTLTGQKVAIKIIDKNKLDKTTAKKLFREVRIMKLLNHENIIRLYEVIDTPDELYLVLEYVSGGEIFDYLVAHGRMKEKEARRHFRQIVSALAYCHGLRIIHRDLKAENLLLDENLNVKIADFGFSNQFTPGQRLNTWCGSPPYAAPELFQGKEYVGPEVDVWSMGVVLYVLVCGSLPFDGSNLSKLRARVIAGKYKVPFYMSPDCERLIKKMLVIDPTKRATLEQVTQDKWFTEGYENEALQAPRPSVEELTPDQHQAVLKELGEIGLDVALVEAALKEGVYDSLAATYFLVADKRFRQKKDGQSSPINGSAASVQTKPTVSVKTSKPTELESLNEEMNSPAVGVAPLAPIVHESVNTPPDVGSPEVSRSSREATTARPDYLKQPAATAPAAKGATNPLRQGAQPTAINRRRATVNAAPVDITELRKQIQTDAHDNNVPPQTPTLAVSAEKPGSAATRTRTVTETPKSKLAVEVPEEKDSLVPSARRERAHTMATNTNRPVLDSEDAPIPITDIHKHLAKDAEEPRTARFTFSLNTTSTKEPDQVFTEVQRVLKSEQVSFKVSALVATCRLNDVSFELEVCKLPNLAVNGLRFRRLGGDQWAYKEVLTDLISKMNL